MKNSIAVCPKIIATIFLAGLTVTTHAWAGGRNVVINGTLMDLAQLAYLDQIHCMAIPDGEYFLIQTGADVWAWGYSALPTVVQGYLGEECGQQGQFRESGNSGAHTSFGWSEDYSRSYGGGISAGDGTYEYYDGATGSFYYE
jgi:hypothetical protein